MKKLIYIPLALGFMACGSEVEKEEVIVKDYVTLSGKITNLKEGDLIISDYDREYNKVITVNADGSFSDTLKVPNATANYTFNYGEEYGNLFLINGDELSFSLDTKEFDGTLKFEGDGANENNYLAKQTLENEAYDYMALIAGDNENFDQQLTTEIEKRKEFITQFTGLNQVLVDSEMKNLEGLKDQLTAMHKAAVEEQKAFALLIGNPSPQFVNYTTPDDKLVSLAKFKGKYTYIDVWATWCGPCKVEIPHIISFLATENGKKINVISLSVDEEEATENWKKMVIEKEMTWPQLKADSSWNSSFITAYAINSIPRFILLDPKGNVVNPNAPRPSSEEFKTLIESLKL